jgi:predicted nucleotidyltransferase
MEQLKALFFNSALKRWYFKELVEQSKMSRERVNHYLNILVKEKFALRVKPKHKMPYYMANRESLSFRLEKRFYGINLLQKSGLFEHINSVKEIKSAILFGSFSRGDWNLSSDIDLFIYGSAEKFDKAKFESILKHEIQLFEYNDSNKLKRELEPKVIDNIAKGFNIKESLEPFRVDVNA